jgi:hypothetical protein
MSHQSNSSQKYDKTVLISMISGLFAGSFAKLFTHPIDTIKAKLQVNTSINNIPTIREITSLTLKNEGIKGLYKGIPISVLGSMPACLLYFGSYEFAKKHLLLSQSFSQSEFLKYFISGMFAETVSCLIFVPVDVIKERRQVQINMGTYKYKSDLDALITILKQERLKGIYKAYGATVLSFGPMSAFTFMFFEFFKGFFVRNDAKTYIQKVKKEDIQELKNVKLDLSFWQSLICSGIAGALASFITNPLDLIKLRMQVHRAQTGQTIHSEIYRHIFHGLYIVGKSEGIRGLYRGSLARVLYHTPTGALSLTFLEMMKPVVRKILGDEI